MRNMCIFAFLMVIICTIPTYSRTASVDSNVKSKGTAKGTQKPGAGYRIVLLNGSINSQIDVTIKGLAEHPLAIKPAGMAVLQKVKAGEYPIVVKEWTEDSTETNYRCVLVVKADSTYRLPRGLDRCSPH